MSESNVHCYMYSMPELLTENFFWISCLVSEFFSLTGSVIMLWTTHLDYFVEYAYNVHEVSIKHQTSLLFMQEHFIGFLLKVATGHLTKYIVWYLLSACNKTLRDIGVRTFHWAVKLIHIIILGGHLQSAEVLKAAYRAGVALSASFSEPVQKWYQKSWNGTNCPVSLSLSLSLSVEFHIRLLPMNSW